MPHNPRGQKGWLALDLLERSIAAPLSANPNALVNSPEASISTSYVWLYVSRSRSRVAASGPRSEGRVFCHQYSLGSRNVVTLRSASVITQNFMPVLSV
jgi:hypothetical protein